MKKILFLAIISLPIFSSCKKFMDDPQFPNNNNNTQPGTEQPTTPGEGSNNNNTQLLATLPVTPVIHNPLSQYVVASVEGTQLNLAFNENVQLLIDAARYKTAWHIIFKEDVTGTQLAGLEYKTALAWGAEANNWAPDNLKQMAHSETDTIISGVKVVNVKFSRVINYFKKYATADEAVEKMNSLIGKAEQVKYSTRYQPDSDTTRFDKVTANIIYKK